MRKILVLGACLSFMPLTLLGMDFDSIFDKSLYQRDLVSERKWTESNALIEHSQGSEGFSLVARDYSVGYWKTEISAAQVLSAFQRLPGMQKLRKDQLSIASISTDGLKLAFNLYNNLFLFDATLISSQNQARRLTDSSEAKSHVTFSPDGGFLSYVEGHNLWVAETTSEAANATTRQLTFDGSQNIFNGELDWVYQEEVFGRGNYQGHWWSPDSQTIAFLKIDERPVQKYPLVDHTQIYGGLRLCSYPKAGTPNPRTHVGLVSPAGGSLTWVDLSHYGCEPPLAVGLDFSPDSTTLILQIQDREQTWLDLNFFKIAASHLTTVFRETSETWVDRLQEKLQWHANGFYWLSAKSGYTHLYRYDLDAYKNIAGERQLTSGSWSISKYFSRNDTTNIYFTAKKDSLLEQHLYVLNAGEGDPLRLSQMGQQHEVSFSPDLSYVIDIAETVTNPASKTLYRVTDTGLEFVETLFAPETKGLNALNLPAPRFETFSTRDGLELNAMIYLPSGFDPAKKYPIIHYNYSGPGIQSVTNHFRGLFYLWHQYLAQNGFVVWIADNRSSSGAGHALESSSYKQLGVQELSDLEDSISHLKQNAWVDSDRIGIWGWSFGGFMSAFALTHSDTYKAGICVAPALDWRLYDSIYTERYMSTPEKNPQGYRLSSVVESAASLQAPLLLVHGTMDDNVHDQHTLILAHRLQQLQKPFEMMLYLQSDHGIKGELHPHLFRKMKEFWDKNLSAHVDRASASL